MDDQFTYYDKIDLYFSNSMSNAELADFENELTNNLELREEVSTQKELRDIVIGSSLSDVRSLMENDLNNKSIPAKKGKAIWGIIGLTLITSLGIFIYNDNQPTTLITNNDKETVSPNKVDAQPSPQTQSRLSQKTPSVSTRIEENDVKEEIPRTIIQKETRDTLPTQESMAEVLKKEIQTDAPLLTQEGKVIAPNEKEQATSQRILPLVFKGDLKTVKEDYERGNGQITIEGDVSGGVPPYSYFIFENELQQGKLFTNLEAGTYLVKAVDANNTTIKLGSVTITASNCITDYNQSFIPAYDEYWEIPVVQNAAFDFKVYSLNGLEFEEKFDLGEETVWFGLSSKEEKLGIGYYRFEINYENGETCYGELTIGN